MVINMNVNGCIAGIVYVHCSMRYTGRLWRSPRPMTIWWLDYINSWAHHLNINSCPKPIVDSTQRVAKLSSMKSDCLFTETLHCSMINKWWRHLNVLWFDSSPFFDLKTQHFDQKVAQLMSNLIEMTDHHCWTVEWHWFHIPEFDLIIEIQNVKKLTDRQI